MNNLAMIFSLFLKFLVIFREKIFFLQVLTGKNSFVQPFIMLFFNSIPPSEDPAVSPDKIND